MAKRKLWSKIIEEHGVQVRLFERRAGGPIWREVKLGRAVSDNGTAYTRKDRRSLGHSDRNQAQKEAAALCRALAEQELTGRPTGSLTIGQLRSVYLRERGPMLTPYRRGEIRKLFGLLERHLGAGFDVVDLGPHQVDTYVAARQAGTLRPDYRGNVAKGVKASTLAKELGVLHAALNWAATFRRGGRPLISGNPLRGVPLPSEPNPSRPVATRERFEKLLEQADALDELGRFRTMLLLAWYTGRRLGSIVALRASDLLLTPDHVYGALARAGADEHIAAHWPAAISWSAEADKEGVAWIVPIPEQLRTALAEYVRARKVVGNALLFHASRDREKPLSKETAYYWLRQAEKRAGLPHQNRGGWHSLRRAWATARKHLPLQDVMMAGGWRDPSSLQRAYQHADAETVRAVMEFGT